MVRMSAVILASLAILGCSREASTPIPQQGVVALSAQFTGDFALIAANGEAASDEDFAGKVMLVYFGFTHCPDVCPGDVGVMSAALNELGEDAGEIAPIFISVDPERDTPAVLAEYFAFDDRIIALTGSVEAAKAARTGYKLFAQKVALPDSALEYTVEHGRFFYIADRAGQPQYAVVGGVTPAELAAILRRSIKAKR
ncbi:Cytochrome oxidase biogenesis protein Sco1/SenC/PrrC, thiol-disulfide reductase involved in Cu(I) insertion into CoxII Cu(A) center [hydrothermal vent metagenome]|uniref:Cytochrome oxidase biogenesis protein Sco1/SenC/PrrC, thiol-disulfide reductase involved in Cu(I) insertion into CoxII Cu(A) center n=1 Tax=hydrothermal vent metagenome TaxID=652676 RepID=A0A3B0RMB1_9ZZZZ